MQKILKQVCFIVKYKPVNFSEALMKSQNIGQIFLLTNNGIKPARQNSYDIILRYVYLHAYLLGFNEDVCISIFKC